MLNGKEGRLLRRNNDKDTRMKINIYFAMTTRIFCREYQTRLLASRYRPERPFA